MFPVVIFPVRRHPSYPFFHLRHPTSLMLLSRVFSVAVSIPVVLHLCHCDCLPLSSPLTLYDIPVIPHLHRASIVVLLRLCCGHHCIIFHYSVHFAAVVCLPSPIGYSPRSESLCATMLDPL